MPPYSDRDSANFRVDGSGRHNGMKPTTSAAIADPMSRSRSGKPPLPADEAKRVHAYVLKLYAECEYNSTELGRKLGISRVAAKALVDGSNNPSIPTIKSLASALRLTEMELRTGKKIAATGAERALEVALEYSPGRWNERVVGKAWAKCRAGERHSPREWTTVLDELAQVEQQ